MNPYVAGNPVGGGPAFVGREDVLQAVVRTFERPQANALVLYGQRRIGKTSILRQLAGWLPRSGPFRTVYLDLQDKATWTLDRVAGTLASRIATELGQAPPAADTLTAESFRDTWLSEALDHLGDAALVLLLDEFDVLTDPDAEQAAVAFFPYLRQLMKIDRRRLNFVFVIGRNVDDLHNIALSVFKGTDSRRVSLLRQDDLSELARLSERDGTLSWSQEAIDRIWTWTRGHPYLSQQVCSHVWDRIEDRSEDRSEARDPSHAVGDDVDAVLDDVLDASQNALEWLWDGLPPAERVVTSALAEAGPGAITSEQLEARLHDAGVRVVIRDLQNAPAQLKDWDILEAAEGGYRFRVELLRRWLVDYKPLRRVQEELDRIEPAADNLYRAADVLFKAGQLDDALSPLQQAVRLNPNHKAANQLLADLLISRGDLSQALLLLDRLTELQPAAARPRLIQVLLELTRRSADDAEKQRLFTRVLGLDSANTEARDGLRTIWNARGEALVELGNHEAAIQAFEKADNHERIEAIRLAKERIEIEAKVEQVDALERDEDFAAALDLLQEIESLHPRQKRLTVKRRTQLLQHRELADLYRAAKTALDKGHDEQAITSLVQVVGRDPRYKDVTTLLDQAVARSKNDSASAGRSQGAGTARERAPTKRTARRDQATEATQTIRPLSATNPIDYVRVAWWAFVTPNRLQRHRALHTIAGERTTTTIVAALFLAVPQLLVTLTFVASGQSFSWIATIFASLTFLLTLLTQHSPWFMVGLVTTSAIVGHTIEFIDPKQDLTTLSIAMVLASHPIAFLARIQEPPLRLGRSPIGGIFIDRVAIAGILAITTTIVSAWATKGFQLDSTIKTTIEYAAVPFVFTLTSLLMLTLFAPLDKYFAPEWKNLQGIASLLVSLTALAYLISILAGAAFPAPP